MPRGGARKGTPGRSYSNRSDLNTNYSPQQGLTTAAAGGQAAPAQPAAAAPAAAAPVGPPPGPVGPTPDDTPNLLDPTAYPDEPLTAGMPIGPGPGPEALGLDTRRADTQLIRDKWLPMFELYADSPETPQSVRSLIAYIRSV